MLLRFCGTVLAMPLAAWLLPGVEAQDPHSAWVAGILLGLLYLLLRPLVKLVLSPLNCLTMGIIGFLADMGLLYLATDWLEGFHIQGLSWLALTCGLVTVLREILGGLSRASR